MWDFQLSCLQNSLNLLSDIKVTSAADEASDTQHETITTETGQSNLGRDLRSERCNILTSSREPQKSMMWHVNPCVKKTEFHLIFLSVQSSAIKPQCWILNWPNRQWKSFKSLSEVSSELSGESFSQRPRLPSLLLCALCLVDIQINRRVKSSSSGLRESHSAWLTFM